MTYKPMTDEQAQKVISQLKLAATATDNTMVQLFSQSLADEVFPDGEIIQGDIVTRKVAQNWIEGMKKETPNRDCWFEYIETGGGEEC